jgi:hypothetical protein
LSTHDSLIDRVQVLVVRGGVFLLIATLRACEEPAWQLPAENRRAGEAVESTIDRALRRLFPYGVHLPAREFGQMPGTSDIGTAITSLVVVTQSSTLDVAVPPGTSRLWRSLLSGPPHVPGFDEFLTAALPRDEALRVSAVNGLLDEIMCDFTGIPCDPLEAIPFGEGSAGREARLDAERRRLHLLSQFSRLQWVQNLLGAGQ